jgi:type IV pilus assembly protein PilX
MTHRQPALLRRRQDGVALFVALIAMVLLSLAGIALVRSVDTTSGVAGNIAFRQGSIGPVNSAIERAIDALFRSKTIANNTANDIARSYFATLQPLELPNGVPNVLAGDYATMLATYNGAGLPAPLVDANSTATKMEVRYVIERVCSAAGAPTIGTCDTLPPKVSPAGTDNRYKAIPLPPIPNFRVTVRVDLPETNTVSHAQAFVR